MLYALPCNNYDLRYKPTDMSSFMLNEEIVKEKEKDKYIEKIVKIIQKKIRS